MKGWTDPEPIPHYFFEKFSFNSIVKKTKNGKFECLTNKAENKFQVSFIVYTYEEFDWTGMKVNFSVRNEAYFYDRIKKEEFD
jgi:hypothetical protein